MRVVVEDYNPSWPGMFREEAARVADILGDNLLQVFHIGSTAVPGLCAKPIIDMMPVVRNIERVDACTGAFEAIGYEVMGEFGIPGRRYMRKGADSRTHHIHAFQYSSLGDIMRHLAFRDYLRAHPGVCAEYGALKSTLAGKHPNDIDAYCDGKDDFIQRTERDALQWYWAGYGGPGVIPFQSPPVHL